MKNNKVKFGPARLTLATLALTMSTVLPSVVLAHAGPHGGVDISPEPTGPSPFTLIASNLSNPRSIIIDDRLDQQIIAVKGTQGDWIKRRLF